MTPGKQVTVGVISDTHGLLRPEAMATLRGSEHIIHAGDVGAPEILEELKKIAPVTAIRGNIDRGAWARKLPETEVVELGGVSVYILHNLKELDLKPEAAGFASSSRDIVTCRSRRQKMECCTLIRGALGQDVFGCRSPWGSL